MKFITVTGSNRFTKSDNVSRSSNLFTLPTVEISQRSHSKNFTQGTSSENDVYEHGRLNLNAQDNVPGITTNLQDICMNKKKGKEICTSPPGRKNLIDNFDEAAQCHTSLNDTLDTGTTFKKMCDITCLKNFMTLSSW